MGVNLIRIYEKINPKTINSPLTISTFTPLYTILLEMSGTVLFPETCGSETQMMFL